MVASFSETRGKYMDLRKKGESSKLIAEKLNIPNTSRARYEKDFLNLINKATEGTTQAIIDTTTKPISKWNGKTIMMYVGILVGVIVVSSIIIWLIVKCYHYFKPDDKKQIIIDEITRIAQERAEDKYKQELDNLKSTLNQERRLRQEIEKDRDDCKKNCHK